MRILFLDDERDPPAQYANDDVVVVKNAEEFARAILTLPPFDLVSFDYNLQYTKGAEYCDGADCAAWLREKIEQGYPTPQIRIHSHDPYGRKQIIECLRGMAVFT